MQLHDLMPSWSVLYMDGLNLSYRWHCTMSIGALSDQEHISNTVYRELGLSIKIADRQPGATVGD